MSKNLSQLYLTKNGGTKYYLMFHIKPWMRDLPAFKQIPASKKNHKKSLRTSDLSQALEKMTVALAKLDLCIDSINGGELIDRRQLVKKLLSDYEKIKPLNKSEAESYFDSLMSFGMLTEEELRQVENRAWNWFHTVIDEDNPKDENLKIERYHKAQLTALARVKTKEDQKLDPSPHPYKITIEYCKDELLESYHRYGKSEKQKGKLKTAVKKFLLFLEREDIELERITRKYVKRYIDRAVEQKIPYNTLFSELVHLRALWKNAVDEELILNSENPFYGHDLQYLKKPKARSVYEIELVEQMLEAAGRRREIYQLILLSWYSGARVNEIFNCKLEMKDGISILSLAEEGGKTEAAKRFVPIHPALSQALQENDMMPETGQRFDWSVETSNALEKKFLRFKEKFLISKNLEHRNKELVHHSFRNTFITLLLNQKLSELQVAVLTGQSKKTIGQTEAVKTYYRGAGLEQKLENISRLPALQLHPK
tara:strand:- start:34 stop:1482 length:1449 start_codon:yes stop_codon:yes gene_type:complete